MNSIKQIGRYTLPLGSVLAIKQRPAKTGWRRLLPWYQGGYDALLNNGRAIHLTEKEKKAYDEAMDWQELTLQVYGACKGMGLRT